jgi:hypothetical protein
MRAEIVQSKAIKRIYMTKLLRRISRPPPGGDLWTFAHLFFLQTALKPRGREMYAKNRRGCGKRRFRLSDERIWRDEFRSTLIYSIIYGYICFPDR